MAILHVKKLIKTYSTVNTIVTTLGSMSFSMRKGEFTAINGVSGSGKSALMQTDGVMRQ